MKLTQIARNTIELALDNHNFELDDKTKSELSEEKACFVTLTKKNGELRGCIGSLEATQELWRDIQENSLNAAFKDPRFPPLKKSELKNIKIEVSVLTTPQKLNYTNEYNLLNKINSRMGIILKRGHNQATFLPQVWEEIPNKIQFLENLSRKAGLSRDAWKTSEFWYYGVEKEEEDHCIK